jgi:hypothetical protein
MDIAHIRVGQRVNYLGKSQPYGPVYHVAEVISISDRKVRIKYRAIDRKTMAPMPVQRSVYPESLLPIEGESSCLKRGNL